jgi:hypothetical protein
MSDGLPPLSGVLIKDGIVLFWAAWISIVVVTNVAAALRVAGLLSPDTNLASGNYTAIVKVSDRLSLPHALDFILFLVIILWETIAAILLWRAAVYSLAGSPLRTGATDTGLGILLALFALFMLADEIFHAFEVENDHRGIAAFILISLIAIHLPLG